MKRIVAVLFSLAVVLSLCACGSDGAQGALSKDAPSEQAILKDLTIALEETNPHAVLKEIETVKSLTGEGTYELTVQVFAETKYADWTYEADMDYTKYDQGWIIDDFKWNLEKHSIARVPDADEMLEIVMQSVGGGVIYPDQFPIKTSEFSYDEAAQRLNFNWTYETQFLHAIETREEKTIWTYDAENDIWVCTSSDNSQVKMQPLPLDYTGTWPFGKIKEVEPIESRYYSDEAMSIETVISNYTGDSFDLYNPLFSADTVHFYKIEDSHSHMFPKFTDGNDHYLTVTFREKYTRLSINVAPLVEAVITEELPAL